MYREQYEKQQVMPDHTRPRGDKSVMENACAYKRAGYAYTPHTEDAVYKRCDGAAYTLHHALDDNSNSVERL